MQGRYERPYGVAMVIPFVLEQLDGVDHEVDAVAVAGDIKIGKDEGAEANTTNLFVDRGTGYSLALTATEAKAARIMVHIIDQTAPKAWLDTTLVIETYGHPSAQKPGLGMGTAQSGTASTIVLAATEAFADDVLNDNVVRIVKGTGAGQARVIASNTLADDTCNVAENWTTNPDSTSVYEIVEGVSTAPTAAVVADAVWDEVLTGGTHNVPTSAGRRLRTLQDFGLYEDGAVWIDTVGGTAGTTDFENGTVNNPVDSLADAKTLADSIGLIRFRLLSGSSVTLATAHDGYEFEGVHYTVALNGQSISGTQFHGAVITGNDSGSNADETHYRDCDMAGNSLGTHHLSLCRLLGDMVLTQAGDYFWDGCYSGVAGTGTPSVDMQSAVEVKNLSVRHFSGGLEFKNFGAGGGTHTASVEGHGQIILNANCAGGTIAVRGPIEKTDNAGGAVTLVDDARLTKSEIAEVTFTDDDRTDLGAILADTGTDGVKLNGTQPAGWAANLVASASKIKIGTVDGITHTPTTTEFESDDITDALANNYKPRVVIFTSGIFGEITAYAKVGANGHFTVTTMPAAPSNDEKFVIV